MKKEYVTLVEGNNKAIVIFEGFKTTLDFNQLIEDVSQLDEISVQGIWQKLSDFLATSDELDGRDRVTAFAMEVFKTTSNMEIKEQARKVVELSRGRKFEQAAAEIVTLAKLMAQPKPITPEIAGLNP
jgi:hypothetical protein